MKKTQCIITRVSVALCCIAALVPSFGYAQERSVKRKGGGGKTNSAVNRGSSGNGQAQAERFWSKYAASCGGASRYVKQAPGIFIELRGFGVRMEYEAITEADRLNRIEAKGVSRFYASSRRVYSGGAWHEWQDGISEEMKLGSVVRFRKTLGSGAFNFSGVGYFNDYAKPIVCSELPGRQTARGRETPTNMIRINDTHVFPVREFSFWDSNTRQSGTRFPQSTTTFVNWKILYQQMSFDYTLSGVEQYWYDKNGAQMAHIDTANFSNNGDGQLYWGIGWAEAGRWQVGTYTVKIYQNKQLVAAKSFDIVPDESLPKVIRCDGLYYRKFDDGNYWFLRFFENGTVRDIRGRYRDSTVAESSFQNNLEKAWNCTNDDMLGLSNGANQDYYCADFSVGEGAYRVGGGNIGFSTKADYHRGNYIVSFKGSLTNTALTLDWNNGQEDISGSGTFVYTRCPYLGCN